jgi:uncharacterized protein
LEYILAGNIYKAEYLKIATDVKNYIENIGRAPDFAYPTSIGPYLRYENMVYMYSMIMDYYNTSGKKADFAAMKPWGIVTKSFKVDVVVGGTGGYIVSNNLIISSIPNTAETFAVLEAAKSGTPMVTFGNGNGPKVMIVAGVHGNEIPATIAAMNLINYLYGKTIAGTIYIIPFAIPANSASTTRYWNGQNPNSVANVPGTPTNQILNLAKQLNVNALGDFHSSQPGGVPGRNAAMYTQSPTYESYVIASYISAQTGSALVGAYQAGVDYPGALEDVTNLAGIPAVTCEVIAAHGTADPGIVNFSFNQMLSFLRYKSII